MITCWVHQLQSTVIRLLYDLTYGCYLQFSTLHSSKTRRRVRVQTQMKPNRDGYPIGWQNCVIISDPVFLQQSCKVSTFFHFLQTHRVWLARAQACKIIPASCALHWIQKTFSERGCCQPGADVPTERKRALQTRVLSTATAMLKPRLDYVITKFA